MRYAVRSFMNRTVLAMQVAREQAAEWGIILRNRIYQWAGKPVPMPLTEQRDQLIEFYEQFEGLSDLICDAAHHGQGAPWQASYERVRRWMSGAYPAIRPYLIAHLSCDTSDDEFGLRCVGRPTDAFEALFASPTVDELLAADQGDLMDRLDRARSALYRYADHLRRLMAN